MQIIRIFMLLMTNVNMLIIINMQSFSDMQVGIIKAHLLYIQMLFFITFIFANVD